jgi:hypothetical protein
MGKRGIVIKYVIAIGIFVTFAQFRIYPRSQDESGYFQGFCPDFLFGHKHLRLDYRINRGKVEEA